MIKGNRGQTMGITILSCVVIFIIGIMCINLLMPEVSDARINLSCDSPSTISDGTKFLCLIVDVQVPYFIWLVFSISMGAILVRMRMGGGK